MTAAGGFNLHPEAAQDIVDIWEYIARDNPTAAGRVREDLLQALRDLVAFPRSGHLRPDLTARPLRFKRVRDYLIASLQTNDRCGWLRSCTAAATRASWLRFFTAASGKCAETDPSRAQSVDLITGQGGCVGECLTDVVLLEIRQIDEDLRRRHAVGDEVDDVRHRDAQTADCGAAAKGRSAAFSARGATKRAARTLASWLDPIEANASRRVSIHCESRYSASRVTQELHCADGIAREHVLRDRLQNDVRPARRSDH
jgi:plasmid stabilization system protein ParE